MKQKLILSILTLCMIFSMTHPASAASDPESPGYAIFPKTSKASSKSIQISWDSSEDDSVKYYYVMKRSTQNNQGTGKWKTAAKIKSDGIKNGSPNTYTDQLSSSKPQQYEYKICVLSKDGTIDTRKQAYEDETNARAVLGTNIKICIDPGHYGSLNNNYELDGENGKYPYSEAKYNLKIGQSLQKELRGYGIDSYLTRSGSSISLTYNGQTYTNANLDDRNISVRGAIAKTKGCDFFISLHTNSTSRETDPWNQPASINKVYVFVNQAAHAKARGMKIANSIGTRLTAYNKDIGMQTAGFVRRKKNNAANFTNLDNDSSKTDGTVVCRLKSNGDDYYGVLRGASANRVPGILVEHAFHATQIMRQHASGSTSTELYGNWELYEHWAACDAYGIAYGYGFIK